MTEYRGRKPSENERHMVGRLPQPAYKEAAGRTLRALVRRAGRKPVAQQSTSNVPVNLDFAFALTWPSITQGGVANQVVAYRVVGSTYTPNGSAGWQELNVNVTAGQSFDTTQADGDGLVGEYVVFAWTATTPGSSSAAEVATSLGWNPFDPANQA